MSPGHPRSVFTAELLLLIGFTIVALQARALLRGRASLLQAAHDDVLAATRAAAAELDRQQRECMAVVRAVAADLDAGRLSLAGVERRLAQEVAKHPHVFGLVVVFAASGGAVLIPANIRRERRRVTVRLDHGADDVRRTDWYRAVAAHPEPGWHGPFRGPFSGHFIALYCEPWSPPARRSARGHVCASLSLHDVEAQRQSLPSGRFGYSWVLSHEGRTLAHPKVDWVRAAKTPEQLADETGDARLAQLSARIAAGAAGTLHARDPLTGRRAEMIHEPIAASGGAMVAVILRDDVLAAEPSLRRLQIEIAAAVLATFTAVIAVLLGGRR
ncbi:hypothetical protein [Nannocystis sp. SCPEA4]|uniref:cache domain-containing protein n=1 Tax=Nannocystis sp. SCPEA4 TaxID=2996787 RepID=UPI002270DE69|nr:hypothetical protein [Nannocystis sp. SCPEA4]MCY1055297.1 hypothetical protein [Nannocystis sp. SCPEA4]